LRPQTPRPYPEPKRSAAVESCGAKFATLCPSECRLWVGLARLPVESHTSFSLISRHSHDADSDAAIHAVTNATLVLEEMQQLGHG
jgi:hypothetical protein